MPKAAIADGRTLAVASGRSPQFLFLGAALIGGLALFLVFVLGLRQTDLLGDVAPMSPSTALGFLLSGAALHRASQPGAASRLLIGLAALLAAMATVEILLLSSGVEGGLDGLVLPADYGLMSPATAACFLLTAACLGCLAGGVGDDDFRDRLAVGAGSFGVVVAGLALIAFLFSWRRISEVAAYGAMSPLTAAAFVLLFFGVLLLRPHAGWIGAFAQPNPTSEGARRLLPFAVIGPSLTCYLTMTLVAGESGSSGFVFSLPAVSTSVILIGAIYWGARRGNAQEAVIEATMETLRSTVADRDLLLRELNHRVKNNLQQTNAILFMEQSHLADRQAVAAFERMSARLLALAAVHQILIGGERTDRVDLPTFLNDLIDNIAASLVGRNAGVSVRVARSDAEMVDIDTAMTIGLVVNELVMNAVKHAYPAGREGEIVISSRIDGRSRRIEVADDGIGGAAAAAKDSAGYGALIVDGLVAQLDGAITIDRSDGTRAVITMAVDATPGAANAG